MPQTTNSITPNKLTVPDLISVGVFTALYFVLVTVATFTCALLPGVGNIVLPALAALISGSVYMLLAAKLQKFGGITIMGLVMGLFFFVSGHFVLSFAANIVCGLLAKRFPMLISGYNTMPEEKRKNVDIEGLSSFVQRHLVIIGCLWILLATTLALTDQQDALPVILVIYLPVYVIWMVVRAQRYDHNERKR